ncbi:MAG: hypothetical protein IJ289_02180 [Clostridia bacterium]|nr:hypothetical protein [Clostridia bacterium]
MGDTTESRPQYELTQSDITVESITVRSYGISGVSVSFEDVSTDKGKVLEMIDRLNREQVEESQFMYFIQDEIDR